MVGYLIMGISFVYGWSRIPIFKNLQIQPSLKVSVLIAARNEEDTIPLCLQDLLTQTYPKHLLEIIVIDDHSTDLTVARVLAFQNKQIKLIQLNEPNALNSYKKKAISTAIGEATGDFIITTDADCRMGTEWVNTLVSCYQSGGYKMVSAPVGFIDNGRIFQKFQSMEFANLIGLGAAAIGNGFPFTCNGANLGYSKATFFELGGFKGIDDLASGDDELLLHKVAFHHPKSIGFVKSSKAIVYTHAKEDIRDFLKQRKRWASKSVKYTNKRMIIISVTAFFFNVFIAINILLSIFFPVFRVLLILQIALKIILELFLMIPVLKFMNQLRFLNRVIPLLPIYFFLYTTYMVYIGLSGNSGKYEWKGRIVR